MSELANHMVIAVSCSGYGSSCWWILLFACIALCC